MDGSATTSLTPYCGHCGGIHQGPCPRIKAVEYYPNGTMKRVEYHGVATDAETLSILSNTFQLCEMCADRTARWHQEKPVDRWLCNACARRDQSDTFPKAWQGQYFGEKK